MHKPLAILIAAALLLPLPALALRVPGEALRPVPAAEGTATFRSTRAVATTPLLLQELPLVRIEALRRSNERNPGKALQIGLNRSVADEAAPGLPAALPWQPVPGGQVVRFDVVSPGAAALRVAIDLRRLPAGAELRSASPMQAGLEHLELVNRRPQAADEQHWTAVTAGERQQIEIFLPGPMPASPLALPVRQVSHLLASPFQPSTLRKALGSSGACNLDVACRRNLGAGFDNAENAVALMVFTEATGSFTCTGTLLNDTVAATQVPYFFSAHHCVNTQDVAGTVNTFWEYESHTCGLPSSGINQRLTGGTDLLWSSAASDALLLRLRASPPASAFLAGWDSTPIPAGSPAIALHHPAGDRKMVSSGSVPGTASNVDIGGQVLSSSWRASWAEGTTEGGSSGSGLFTLSNGQYLLRGGLAGGTASCANSGLPEAQGNVDFYSRFDQVFPSLRAWLAPTTAGPSRDYSGAWFNASESGWGATIFQYPDQLFVLWFVYDTQGRPVWYRMQGAWTGLDTITQPLLRPSGPNWSLLPFNPAAVGWTTVGSATLTFTGPTSATLQFNDGTVNRSLTLTRL